MFLSVQWHPIGTPLQVFWNLRNTHGILEIVCALTTNKVYLWLYRCNYCLVFCVAVSLLSGLCYLVSRDVLFCVYSFSFADSDRTLLAPFEATFRELHSKFV